MQACIEEELPPASELDESLRTGVILCKLGHWCAPEALPLRKIYDLDGTKFAVSLIIFLKFMYLSLLQAKGLHFKHTDNFNFWLRALKKVGLPEVSIFTHTPILTLTVTIFQIFYPETTDLYDKKNMPRVIYCIHALRCVLGCAGHIIPF